MEQCQQCENIKSDHNKTLDKGEKRRFRKVHFQTHSKSMDGNVLMFIKCLLCR